MCSDRVKAGTDDKEILTVADVAEYLCLHAMTVYRWASEGKLPSFRIGRMMRFSRADIDAARKADPKRFLGRRKRKQNWFTPTPK
jgi:excisionase family DNA binding protein